MVPFHNFSLRCHQGRSLNAQGFDISTQVKIGKVRAWEYFDSGPSSSVAPGGSIKEVEIQYILRRVQGENFFVKPMEVNSQPLPSRMVGAIDKIFTRIQVAQEHGQEPHVPTAGFKPIAVLADGYCFWHCFLRASLPEEYSPYERNSSGGPKSKQRLTDEIHLAQVAREEFLHMYAKQPNFDEVLLKCLQESPQVPMEYMQAICLASGVALRITLSQEASLWEPKIFDSLPDQILRIYGGSQEESVTTTTSLIRLQINVQMSLKMLSMGLAPSRLVTSTFHG